MAGERVEWLNCDVVAVCCTYTTRVCGVREPLRTYALTAHMDSHCTCFWYFAGLVVSSTCMLQGRRSINYHLCRLYVACRNIALTGVYMLSFFSVQKSGTARNLPWHEA